MIRAMEDRNNWGVGLPTQARGLAIGHGRRMAEALSPLAGIGGHGARPAAIVTISAEGRALAKQALEAEGAAGHAVPRGIAKKLAASPAAAAPASTPAAPTTGSMQRQAGSLAAGPVDDAGSVKRTAHGQAWGHLIRPGAAAGQAAAPAEPEAPARAAEPGRLKLSFQAESSDHGRSRHELLRAAAARVVADARTQREDQRASAAEPHAREAGARPGRRAHDAAGPQPAQPAIDHADAHAGLAAKGQA